MQVTLGVQFLGGLVCFVWLTTTNILFAHDFMGQLLGLGRQFLAGLAWNHSHSCSQLAGWWGPSLGCIFASRGLILKQDSPGFYAWQAEVL